MTLLLINYSSNGKLPSLPEKVNEDFKCSDSHLTSLKGSPIEVNGYFDCSDNFLTDLIGSPRYVVGIYRCSGNHLTTLEGSPFKVASFDCSYNKLIDLVGSPSYVGKYFCCDDNQLSSLFDAPAIIKENLYMRRNPNLLDISDIWDSDIRGTIFFDLNIGIALLPLIKFVRLRCGNEIITTIHKKNQGSSKQNIIDFQYDLIENGFEENARWKPGK